MRILPTALPDVLLLEPPVFQDGRGHFAELWNRRDHAAAGLDIDWVQDNQAFSARAGTLRGLHFQAPPRAQAKLVQVVHGAVFDVVVDLRRGSAQYGEALGQELRATPARQLYVPAGFAHGYLTLRPDTLVHYKVADYFAPEFAAGIAWDDPALGIAWPMPAAHITINDRDRGWPRLAAFDSPFKQAG